MDADDKTLAKPPADEAPRPAPVMDVVPPPASAEPDEKTPEAEAKSEANTAPAKSKPTTPRQSGNGVTTAIIATVIIVLGLAVLAVFAYLKSPK